MKSRRPRPPAMIQPGNNRASGRDRPPGLPGRSATPPPRFPRLLEASFRWGIVLLLLFLLIGSTSARRAAMSNAVQLGAEVAELERERDELRGELNRFSDPAWRACYWKWRTMRHEPGEYYIDFMEPGSL